VRTRLVILSLAIALTFSVTFEGRATIPVFDPINYAKNVLIQANTLKATINQATQIAYQLRQLEMQVQALRNIPRGAWGQIQTDLAQLRRLMQLSRAISYTDENRE